MMALKATWHSVIPKILSKYLSGRSDLSMTEEDAIKELIKRGLAQKVPTRSIKINNQQIPIPERYKITTEAEERLYFAISSSIEKNAISMANLQLQSILFKIDQLPQDLQKDRIGKAIEISISTQSQFNDIDENSTRSLILNSFSFEDYLKFNDGESIFHKSEVIVPEIRRQANLKLTALLRAELIFRNTKPKKAPVKRSYIWQGSSKSEVSELYELLLKGRLISADCTSDQFHAIFSGELLQDIVPVKWNRKPNELLYFILRLGKTGNIQNEKDSMDFHRLTACFLDSEGHPFTTSFKNIKKSILDEIELDERTERRRVIDSIIAEF